MLQKETRTNYGEFQEWRRKTNRISKRKKRENMKKHLEGFSFFFLALQPPLGVVFYSPLAGFSLLAYEVS